MTDTITPPKIEFFRDGFKVGRKTYRYKVNDEPTRSVTEILEYVFGKGKFSAGANWGQRTAVTALCGLVEQGIDVPWDDPNAVIGLLKQHRATVNQVRDDAGERGSSVHMAAELYAETGQLPNADAYPEEQRGYVRSLIAFLREYRPEIEDVEIAVASVEHGYAGTYDARAVIDGRTCLLDYKTSSYVYDAYLYQLRAYEDASIECGYAPTDFRAVVHLTPDGQFTKKQFVESKVTTDQWLAALHWYKVQTGGSA